MSKADTEDRLYVVFVIYHSFYVFYNLFAYFGVTRTVADEQTIETLGV